MKMLSPFTNELWFTLSLHNLYGHVGEGLCTRVHHQSLIYAAVYSKLVPHRPTSPSEAPLHHHVTGYPPGHGGPPRTPRGGLITASVLDTPAL
ncbi:hypothetical protein DSO57_1001934 [Entomophthora muscae]|uniref:Uncharacterized protein n=1 Tax=Entomophthora muscae TaxID=34485 RepID=A0ACC2UVE6_9FUNG|nr:hypothetical protein DSO57_1001934 [Entomophthora muscae]